jgi:hypothetical protein
VSGGSWEREVCLRSAAFALTRWVGALPCYDSGRFAIVAAVLGGLWWFYLRRDWQERVFGDTVAHASEHPVRLRRQNRELAHVNGNNNIAGVNLG